MSSKGPQNTVILIALVLVFSLGGGLIGFRYADQRKNILLQEQEIEEKKLLDEIEDKQEEIDSIMKESEELEEKKEDNEIEIQVLEHRLRKLLRDVNEEISVVDSTQTDGFKFIPTTFDITPDALQYTLPIETSMIANIDSLQSNISVSQTALEMLKTNGFVVIENPLNPSEESVQSAYKKIMKTDIPIFVTSDSLLHLYHIQFDETLRDVEERVFFDDIWNISKALYDYSIDQYISTEGTLREAHRRNAAYFGVALSLLMPDPEQVEEDYEYFTYNQGSFYEEDLEKYNVTITPVIIEDVENELEKVDAHEGFSSSRIFIYDEDYSQYVPRGHYTRSEKLKNYFKTLMWFGRMSMLLKGDENIAPGTTCSSIPPCTALISVYDAEVQTKQACLVSIQMLKDGDIWSKWERMYDVTSFYVGVSDDLGPYEYMGSLQDVFTGEVSPDELDKDKILELKLKLAEFHSPKIYGGTGNIAIDSPITEDRLDEVLEVTTGFRLMGQRFVPDAYIFQELVIPSVRAPLGGTCPFTCEYTVLGPMRCFPRGLDVMAILGSGRAEELLEELDDSNYENYAEQYEMLKDEFSMFTDEEWNRNLYWSWLSTLKPLLKEYDEGYPTFMQTEAWGDKQLTAALGSWSQLRHDTILYAKQSYSVLACSAAVLPECRGYVEPVPEFYTRLLDLTKMTRRGLLSYSVLDTTATRRLVALEEIIERLIDISEKELSNEPLTDDDYVFIRDFGENLDDVLAAVDSKAKKTTIIADVHTDPNSNQALEEGTGYLRLMLAAYMLPDGSINIGAGPVFSYYEFKQPMNDRLTDEAWREKLESNPPSDPEWVQNYTE